MSRRKDILKRAERLTAQMVATSDVDELAKLKDQFYELNKELELAKLEEGEKATTKTKAKHKALAAWAA